MVPMRVALAVLLAGAAAVFALAAGVIVSRSPLLVTVIVVVAIAAAAFDVREVAHQIDESRNGVATLAAVTALLHVVTALIGCALLLSGRRQLAVA